MANEPKALEKVVLIRLLRLNATAQGLVFGFIAGAVVFIATNWLLIKAEEGEVVGPHLSLLGQFFIGYEVSFVGSLIGLAYAFVTGFVLAYGMARIYNRIVDLRDSKSGANR